MKNKKNELKDLIGFYSFQVFRSKKMREIVCRNINFFYTDSTNIEKEFSNNQKYNLIKAILFFESMIFLEDLVNSNYLVKLLINNTDTDFNTSDSPAIVLNKNKEGIGIITEFNGFIPLTPKILLILSGFRETNSNLQVCSISDVNIINYFKKNIETNSETHIYKTS